MSGSLRKSPLHDVLAASGARFAERDGALVPAGFDGEEAEYRRIRSAIGLTDFSFLLKYRSTVEDAIYHLDEVLAGNVANIRYGRVLHTFLANEAGELRADVYVASNDEEILVLAEPCAPKEEVDRLLLGGSDLLQDVTDDFAVLSMDGPSAWGIPRDTLSRDVLGMPYLSVENHHLDGVPVRLLRAGKTGEFGYLAVVPADQSVPVWNRFLAAGERYGVGPCGLEVFDLLKLDGRFFNVNREGRMVKDPLPLGLQWMVDFQKEKFSGRDAILGRRAAGVTHKIIGIGARPGARGMRPGDRVLCGSEEAGSLVTTGFSYTLGREMGLALLGRRFAYAGLDVTVVGETAGPIEATSLSLPPFLPKSLTVKLDEIL